MTSIRAFRRDWKNWVDEMKFRIPSWWALIAGGVFISIFTFISVEFKDEGAGYIALLFGCMLMICGALLKTRDELNMTERRLFNEMVEFEKAMIKLGKIERKQLEGISNWRLRDTEYRLRDLEKRAK